MIFMSKFIVKPDFWAVFPHASIAVVLAKGVDNASACPEAEALLEGAHREAGKYLGAAAFAENPAVAVWREAYRQFKTKKGARCSIEALLKRVENGRGVGPINPLVDIYNAVSLTWGLPCGGEDLDTFQGDLLLCTADGTEPFRALGDEEDEPPFPGEIVYKDDAGAVCRCWNWRDGQRTMLTENTKNAFLILECVDPVRTEDLKAAAAMLAEKVQTLCGGTASVHILSKDAPEAEL